MTRRQFLECESAVAEDVRVFCFLRHITIKQFVTKALKDRIEPYQEWLKSVRELSKPE